MKTILNFLYDQKWYVISVILLIISALLIVFNDHMTKVHYIFFVSLGVLFLGGFLSGAYKQKLNNEKLWMSSGIVFLVLALIWQMHLSVFLCVPIFFFWGLYVLNYKDFAFVLHIMFSVFLCFLCSFGIEIPKHEAAVKSQNHYGPKQEIFFSAPLQTNDFELKNIETYKFYGFQEQQSSDNDMVFVAFEKH